MWADTTTAQIFDKYTRRRVQFLLKKISELDTKTVSEDGFRHAGSDMRTTTHVSAKARFNDILYLAVTFFFCLHQGGGKTLQSKVMQSKVMQSKVINKFKYD